MNKVLIAEPVYSAMPPAVYFNRIAFWKEATLTRSYDHRSLVMGPRNGIRYARDRAIRTAIESRATHLFFIDDDILVAPNILLKLLEVNRAIVGGLVHRDNGDPLVFRSLRLGDDAAALEAYAGYPVEEIVWKDHPKEGAFECAAIAAGCMLIETSVLAVMQDKRWLFNYDDTDRSMDVNFCRDARTHGFTVWCWPDIPCTQIKHYA